MKNKLWFWLLCLMIMTCFTCFGCGGVDDEAIVDEGSVAGDEEDILMDEAEAEEVVEEATETHEPTVITDLVADYYIDYENGTVSIGDLPIGARVVDSGWTWEFRTGRSYSREEGDQTKPVIWIVVAHDHYEGLESHVTLLSEELIGRHAFDNSSHVTDSGYSHWGESGTHSSADRGLRPWLNSTGIHSDEGFYQTFSESFKNAILTTTLPNREWENGNAYSTSDNVFIPSSTELGDTQHAYTYQIGSVYPYFEGADDAKRVAWLNGETWYWTRSPASVYEGSPRIIESDGFISGGLADDDEYGVRPALNLKSEILLSEINP